MALKTSLVIAGDASEATGALREVDQALAKNTEQAKALSAAYETADRSIERVAAAQTTAKQATAQAKAEFAAGQISVREYNARLLETKTALGLVESEHRQAVNAIKQAQSAIGATSGVTRQAQAGYVNLGRQAQDVAVQLQSGTNIGTIIAQQGGQVADAVAQMGGRFAGFASFMAGPWGAAITVGVGVLINLVEQMWLSSDAAEAQENAFHKVEAASDGLSSAQQALGGVFDLTTGKIKAQNEMLILNARLMAVNLRAEALSERTSARKTLGNFAGGELGLSTGKKVLGALGVPVYGDTAREQAVRRIAQGVVSGDMTSEAALRASEKLDFKGLAVTKQEFQQAIIDRVSSGLKDQTAKLIDQSLDDKSLAAGLRKTGTPKKTPRPKGGSGDKAEFGEDAAAKIARLRDQFSDVPGYVQKVNEAMRQLDDIASDVEKKKPPNYKELVGDIASAKDLIQESLNKPLNDYLEKARASAEIDKLLIAGKDDEARALQVILQLKDQMGPLDDEQLAAVLATVQAERERSMVLRDQRALIDANVRGIQSLRGALEQTVADTFRGKFSIGNIIRSIGQSYVNIMSQRIVEGLFGDALRELEDQAAGVGKVKQAGEKMAAAMGDGSGAVTDFAKTVRDAIGTIDQATKAQGGASSSGVAAGAIAGTSNVVTQAVQAAVAYFQRRAGGGAPESTGDPIVVTAKKDKPAPDASGTGELFIDAIDKLSGVVGIKLPKVLTDTLKGVFKSFEQSLPGLLAGALTGQAASNAVFGGSGGSKIGGAIGGAIGKKLGEKFLTAGLNKVFSGLGQFAGPLGAIAGGLLGGAIGKLFSKVKSGGASIGLDAKGNAGVTGTAGNSAELKKTASGYAGTVVSALDQIAQALGADLGQFAVAIGKRSSGYIKVSASGNAAATTAKRPTSDIIYDGKDEGEAIMAALANAIGDGAIKGVSAAVQKALRSTKDVDKAVKEALKVQQVELAIGGLGATLAKAFADFNRQAAERLRIAKEYGFDVVKLEELNAKDRLKLSEQLLDQQVGSLKQLIEEMTSGSLFEGSAVDQRAKLLEQIAATRADANAGVEGAADKLARLFEQLNQVSKEAYGTTGAFAADRTLILDQAREAIAAANQRVTQAQTAATTAADTAAALEENNDQNAQMLSALGLSNELLKLIAAANAGTGNPVYARLTDLARTS